MVCATSTWTGFWTNCLKPVCSTLTEYDPEGREGSVYDPVSVDVVGKRPPVARLRTTTLAPGTGDPPGSIMRPVMDPRSVCALASESARIAPSAARRSLSMECIVSHL